MSVMLRRNHHSGNDGELCLSARFFNACKTLLVSSESNRHFGVMLLNRCASISTKIMQQGIYCFFLVISKKKYANRKSFLSTIKYINV